MRSRRKAQLPPLPPREFIKIWQTSDSVAEVAQKARRRKGACRTRACRYRQRGVPLKEFPVVEWLPPDWGELAEYGASLLPKESSDEVGEDSAGNGEAASRA